ncbi:hypothetical protein PHLGIDRAFT_122422 [Phlebiopsis gigantea 11061_1 CR5-6]|uniref:Uncharacterized protein n=1 Tax=Phlebiopsis gigantea (strain 11061_1 CR5-6) TaxID=745531 RepID=A0A0C3ND82_PHLG1|nr:hypothetical protein PHLGIDRAFT_122422 [Phlebiopsis gigantea 11061_1 CR5-6]
MRTSRLYLVGLSHPAFVTLSPSDEKASAEVGPYGGQFVVAPLHVLEGTPEALPVIIGPRPGRRRTRPAHSSSIAGDHHHPAQLICHRKPCELCKDRLRDAYRAVVYSTPSLDEIVTKQMEGSRPTPVSPPAALEPEFDEKSEAFPEPEVWRSRSRWSDELPEKEPYLPAESAEVLVSAPASPSTSYDYVHVSARPKARFLADVDGNMLAHDDSNIVSLLVEIPPPETASSLTLPRTPAQCRVRFHNGADRGDCKIAVLKFGAKANILTSCARSCAVALLSLPWKYDFNNIGDQYFAATVMAYRLQAGEEVRAGVGGWILTIARYGERASSAILQASGPRSAAPTPTSPPSSRSLSAPGPLRVTQSTPSRPLLPARLKHPLLSLCHQALVSGPSTPA